jgi:hypothetical protein
MECSVVLLIPLIWIQGDGSITYAGLARLADLLLFGRQQLRITMATMAAEKGISICFGYILIGHLCREA